MKNLSIKLKALLCCFFLTPLIGQAQDQAIVLDSLENVIKTSSIDSIKAEALMDLAWQKMYSDNQEALALAYQGLETLENIKSLRIAGYAYTVIGVVHWVSSSYDSAAYYLDKSAKAYSSKEDYKGLSAVYNNLSMVYQNKSDYGKALEYAIRALETAERIGDEKMIGNSLFSVGNIHYLLEDNPKALSYYQNALKTKIKVNDQHNLQKIYLNLGSTFHNLKALDSAAYYYDKCVIASEQLGDYKALAIASTNLGNLDMDQGKPNQALTHYDRSQEIYQSRLNNDYDYAMLLHSMAKAQLQLGNYILAEDYGKKSLELSEKIKDNKLLTSSHTVLSDIFQEKGEFKNALNFFKIAQTFRDSIFNLDKAALLADIETKYETEKKEAQIILQEAELSRQQASNQRNLIFIFSLLVILILIGILFILNQSRQKKARQLLIQQKEIEIKEAYINSALESQELERKRFAQDLHDGFGQLISALRLQISNLNNDSKDLENKAAIVDKSEEILKEMHTEIRNIAFNLMPATLIQYGLKESLNEFAQRINNSGKIKVIVDTHEMSKRLSEIQEISLYRVIQEWVNNVIKYSKAQKITIQLVQHDNELNLLIEDDGEGFDINILQNSLGNGWRNIQSRLNRIKADFEIDSHPDRTGSSFIIDLPLEKKSAIEQSTLVS
ncbi:signal transduction histidine kinase [Belliella baltica DSM 15883]|uniref:histidine kinase n=1 Tax=Belliella baltica (strain DSM 15883 / CIP 108006 / LMG 21964 / BA134) TaxID=866536 RepID=I3Z4N2_BELBD|nr:sensor histidine kinase [Belliella baltica]AFL84200.1 signal transduction histidine kinase [Belliella baltica DSM 15883]